MNRIYIRVGKMVRRFVDEDMIALGHYVFYEQ